MKILKFGGSSLATSDCIRDVARIVLEEARRGPVIVVLSAFQGVTNQLLDCARLAEKNDRRYDAAWKKSPVATDRWSAVWSVDVEVSESDRKSIHFLAICMTRFTASNS